MKKSPLKAFVKALSLLLLLTTSGFASEQYNDHITKTENGIFARRSSKAKRSVQTDQSAEEAADPLAQRDRFREFITVSTGQKVLYFSPGVASAPFDTVEKVSPNSGNKLSLTSPGVMIGNSGTYLVMYSLCGNFRNTISGRATPMISSLYPSISPPNALPSGLGVVGPLNAETRNSAGATLDDHGGAGIHSSFIANFSAGDCLELQLNNTSATDSIVFYTGGFQYGVAGPVFSMTVIRIY